VWFLLYFYQPMIGCNHTSVTFRSAFGFKATYNMFFNKEAMKTHEKY
jgi:hypothetical protein